MIDALSIPDIITLTAVGGGFVMFGLWNYYMGFEAPKWLPNTIRRRFTIGDDVHEE